MQTRLLRPLALSCALLGLAALPAGANEFTPQLEKLAASEIRAVLANPVLIEAVRAQNARTHGLAEAEILRLDQEWRAQVGQASAPLIEQVLANPAADALRAAQAGSGGLFTEIFVMDGVGLNVAASDTTSDYWQGDEAKWQQTYAVGTAGVHISDVELDESTQTYQAQVSVPVVDPDTREPIGAATFGVNVALIQ